MASCVLVADDVAPDAVQAYAAGLTAVPVRTVTLRTLTPNGRLAAILGVQPGEAWIIRPDCHIAAVVPAADRAILAPAPSAGSWPCPYRPRRLEEEWRWIPAVEVAAHMSVHGIQRVPREGSRMDRVIPERLMAKMPGQMISSSGA